MIKVGILGCGAIGSGIAKSIFKELTGLCELTGICDKTPERSQKLAQELPKKNVIKNSIEELLVSCDLMIEAVNAPNASELIEQALRAKKNVIAMSIGKLLNAQTIFELANTNQCHLLLPSGAIAGIDAIKSASLSRIDKVFLTTRKPISGFNNVDFIKESGINLSEISTETTIFEGSVSEAVSAFPRNINVAATLAIACGRENQDKITIRILTSPDFKINSHEIEILGECGRIITRTENEISPENPKTSHLAVLSCIQSLKGFCNYVKIGA